MLLKLTLSQKAWTDRIKCSLTGAASASAVGVDELDQGGLRCVPVAAWTNKQQTTTTNQQASVSDAWMTHANRVAIEKKHTTQTATAWRG